MKNKRGMSAVISNLIIILLVIVAVTIVWSVVQGLIDDTTSQIDMEDFDINAKITRTEISQDSIEVQVENSGGDPMAGVRIIVYDQKGDTTDFSEDVSISPNGRNTFDIEYSGIVKEIGVEPRVEKEGEIVNSGEVTQTKEFSNKEILNVLGASLWFKLDGGTSSEIGGERGTLYGGMECQEKGKYGQSCVFESKDDYMNVSSVNSLGEAQAYWVYDDNNWNFYFNNSGTEYVNGEEDSSTEYGSIVSVQEGLRVGGSEDFSSGKVDEVIIFNSKLGQDSRRGIMDLELNTA